VRHELFPAEELPPGELRTATAGGISVVVVRAPDGGVYALRDVCPHRGGPLGHGRLENAVDGSDTGDYSRSDDLILRCPWHGHEFDVKTGHCLADPDAGVRTYNVSIDGKMIVLEQ
jgi:nitrite reductase (NADH) small subunit